MSSFGWFLSRIEASLRLPCTSPIKTYSLSLISLLFAENTLSERVRHPCQRSIRSTPESFDLIHSLFSLVSNFCRSRCFFFIFHSLIFFKKKKKTLYGFLCPVTLSKLVSLRFLLVLGSVTTCRQCLVREVASRLSMTGRVTKKCTCRVIEIQMI